MQIPKDIYLYRITHLDNLDYIIKTGRITCPNHHFADPDYINIGDTTLIRSRKLRKILIDPKGAFPDYVAFYFGKRPPMLYNIQNGYQGVIKREPQEIVYLVTTFAEIKKAGKLFVFTDGHAYHLMSQFFNDEKYLGEVDWEAVNLANWYDTENDTDRKRRKQAEFMVYKELQLSAITAFVVYNNDAKSKIITKFTEHKFEENILVKPNWYY